MKISKQKLFYISLVVALILLLISIFSSTSISINTANENTQLVFETKFPNANCSKALKSHFPFFEVKCTPISEDNTNNENTAKPISNEAQDGSTDTKATPTPVELANP